jgi:Flp pilus assembly secretin CpaC
MPAIVRILHASYPPPADPEPAAPGKEDEVVPQGDKGVPVGAFGARTPEEPPLLQVLEWRPEPRNPIGRCERIPLAPCHGDAPLAASLPAGEANGPERGPQRAVHVATARATVALKPAASASEAGTDPAAGLPAPQGAEKTRLGPFEVIDQAEGFSVALRRSKLLRTEVDIDRSVVADPTVCHLVPLTPREVSVVGKRTGATHVTFSFADGGQPPVTYLVRVTPDPDEQHEREQQRAAMERHLADLFPQSQVRLAVAGDLWLVTGQARDATECARILEAARVFVAGGLRASGPEPAADEGRPGDLPGREESPRRLPPIQVVNMLRIASAR